MYFGIAAAYNKDGKTQAVARSVTQIRARYAGIGAGYIKGGISQAVAQNVKQPTSSFTGIGAGFTSSGKAEGRLLTEADKTGKLNQLDLTEKQEDWTTGNHCQYPMLVDLDGGYQDMQRLSPEFRQAMQDFAPPSNNTNASWFGPVIWKALERLYNVKGPYEFPTPGTSGLPGACPAPVGTPLFQVYDQKNQWLYVVIRPGQNSRDLVLARYHCTLPDPGFGQCGQVSFSPPDDLSYPDNCYPITAALLRQDSTDSYIYLFARILPRAVYLFDLTLPGSGSTVRRSGSIAMRSGRESMFMLSSVTMTGYTSLAKSTAPTVF